MDKVDVKKENDELKSFPGLKRLFVLLGLFLLSQIGMFTFGVIKQFSSLSNEPNMSMNKTFSIILIVISNTFLLIYSGHRLRMFQQRSRFPTLKNAGIILSGFIIARVVAIGGTYLLNQQGVHSTANDSSVITIFTGENPLLILLVIGISAPIMEEIVFRAGIIDYWLKPYPIIGVLVSSILFGLVHGPTDIISFLIYGLI